MILNDTPAIFQDNFNTKNPGIPSRTGDLDPNVWGVSRATGEVNFGQGQYNNWASTLLQKCDGTTLRVLPPNDIIICNGQLRQASNDNLSGIFDLGTVTVLAMYPKQPFDFEGRTGTVAFDISNDTNGPHAVWPEFWVTNLPVPTPFNHFDSWQALPQHGFGIRFAAGCAPNDLGMCPNTNNLDKKRWTVDSAVVVRNYVMDDTNGLGGVRTNMKVKQLDCVIASPGPNGPLNHVELRISQNQIDVYATDAGVAPTPATLKHIAVVTDANLSFTRGLIWLQDVHYNADKGVAPSQREHTFTWDNVEFDGPFTYRDFSYDALDNNSPGPNGSVNLGKLSYKSQISSWDVLNMPSNPKAAAVRVLFNFWHGDKISNINITVNGHPHTWAWPYPDSNVGTWRTNAITIPLSDLVVGTNVVTVSTPDAAIVVANVNIVLVDVPGGVPVMPGSNNAYPTGNPVPPPPPPPPPPTKLNCTVALTPFTFVASPGQQNISVSGTVNCK